MILFFSDFLPKELSQFKDVHASPFSEPLVETMLETKWMIVEIYPRLLLSSVEVTVMYHQLIRRRKLRAYPAHLADEGFFSLNDPIVRRLSSPDQKVKTNQ